MLRILEVFLSDLPVEVAYLRTRYLSLSASTAINIKLEPLRGTYRGPVGHGIAYSRLLLHLFRA